MAGKPVGSFYVSLGMDTREFSKKIKLANRELENAFGASAIRASELLAYAVTGVAIAIAGVGAASVKLAADLEVQEKAFARLLGGVDKATAKLNELKDFAAKTPFTFTEVVDASKKLLALGFSAKELIPTLTMVGDAASGLGLNTEGLNRIIKAFGDIRSKGILSTQEIKQLAEAGIPAFEILAQKIGKSIPEAMKMVEDRAITSETAIAAFTQGINEKFGGMMEIQSKTMLGMWSTVVDEAENSMRIIGQQIIQSAGLKSVVESIKDAAADFRKELESSGFQKAFSAVLGEGGKVAILATAGAITAVLIPSIVAAGIAIKAAIIPLLPLIGVGVLTGGVAGLLNYLNNMANESERLAKNAKSANQELSKTISNTGKDANRDEILEIQKKLGYLRAEKEIQAELKKQQEELNSAATSGVGQPSSAYASNSIRKIQELREELRAVSELKAELASLMEIYRQQAQLNNKDFSNAFTGGRTLALNLIEGIRSIDLKKEITGLFPNLMGLTPTPAQPKPTGSSTTKSSGQSEAERLAEKAKSTSDSIVQSYTQQVLGKKAAMELEYQQERKSLDESKAYNKNYRRDLFMLDQIYYQQRTDLMREAADAEAEKLIQTAESRQAYVKQQMEEDAAAADRKYELIAALQEVGAKEYELAEARKTRDLDQFISLLDDKTAAERSYFEARGEMISFYEQLQADANRSQLSKTVELSRTFYDGITSALTNFSGGIKGVGERIKELGLQMIQMIVKWQLQQKMAFMMGESMRASSTAASIAQAATLAAAWAPAAAFANAATFGGASGAASSMMSLARGISPIPFAEGGIVTKPTLAMIGEAGEREAVIPLSKLDGMIGGAGGGVVVNLINQSGVPMTARSSQRMDGRKMVIDFFLSGYSDNVSGIQDIIGRR